ncbi:MAG TPA: hypothetical protein VD814_07390 [Nocardioides sp.]|nr:hypothetical protein [Nocardioides sp.]
MSMSVMAAETHEVNEALSWGIGGVTLVILFLLLGALVAFGGGREHS